MRDARHIRNIAIIAHVDHGKTTLLDGLLKQSHIFRDNQDEMSQVLIMDSGDQEKERGITITAKHTAIEYDGYTINIVDTPGHADFSGEVERTLTMADGVLLIVDAQEGPMPQTKFVLRKALDMDLVPIVIINKIDKPNRRISEVEDEVADLFLELATHESQLHYPTYYSIGRDGKIWDSMPSDTSEKADLTTLLKAIVEIIPAPEVSGADEPFQFLITALGYDNFLGKQVIGRLKRGHIRRGQEAALIKTDGTKVSTKIEKIFASKGLGKVEVDEAIAGDIVTLSGIEGAHIGETVADSKLPEALPVISVESPTLKMYLGPNTSPLKGKEGQFTTGRQIGDRLRRELETNVALRVEEQGIGFSISGRGELHLSVLIETLRREGYEFEVGRPQVVTAVIDGVTQEPVEELLIEVPDEFVGVINQELGKRRAILKSQSSTNSGSSRFTYAITTRSLLGLRGQLLTSTKGTVITHSLPDGYQPVGPAPINIRNGALIATEAGPTTAFALDIAEARGELFVGPGTQVYQGMIVGINNRQEDLDMNVCKGKQLTNLRSSSSEGTIQLTPYTRLSLEQYLDFLADDELLEVTPENLRLRKRHLNPTERKRSHQKVLLAKEV
ncbi:MAG TPA: translational GTPase TypA [Candidatus Saccharimonadales bacterium]|nr:translational GTPase TypA [Candidatus Saccharimonadales bacterium]